MLVSAYFLSELLLVFPLLCAILKGAEPCKLRHPSFLANWFSVSFRKEGK